MKLYLSINLIFENDKTKYITLLPKQQTTTTSYLKTLLSSELQIMNKL